MAGATEAKRPTESGRRGGSTLLQASRHLARAASSRRSLIRAAGGVGSLGVAWAASACSRQEAAAPHPLPARVAFVIQTNAADHTRYWQQFIAWFDQEHPGTKVEGLLPPTGDTYEAKVLTMLAGGSAPDLFHLNNRFIYDFNDRGLLQPLDQLLRRANFPLTDIIPGVLIPYRVGNQLVGIPRDNSTSAVYYNKDPFAASGVKEPATNWTWDDYLETARKLTDPDRQRFGSTFPLIEMLAPAPTSRLCARSGATGSTRQCARRSSTDPGRGPRSSLRSIFGTATEWWRGRTSCLRATSS